MASVDITTYRAFSSSSAQGNPAAVIVLSHPGETKNEDGGFPYALFPAASELQAIATEINLPMTAFVLPLNPPSHDSKAAHYAVRWFNTANEAPLCGHATLAMSEHLFNTVPNPPQTFRYLTRLHGVISASQHQSPFEDGKLVGIEFPELTNLPPVPKASQRWEQLRAIFETATTSTWAGTGEPVGLFEEEQYLLLEYSPDLDLKALPIDAAKLSQFNKFIYLFQISTNDSEHVHTRVVNSINGNVHEDIATGSAHRAIVPHALSNQETRARLEQYHPDFQGNTLQCAQQSLEGGELTVEWLREAGAVRIMGKVTFVGKTTTAKVK
ncbi:phenazine biosynthesis [Fusarium albosuccineum]|uniref:Phenazine biosynthesis n=1 Tax=Fusarium albosuccineum TaxID=1237068 RepID=A0A8H4P718_9HYPO|nr:phenazine biosynthesis [Fusarium albosuccineum]